MASVIGINVEVEDLRKSLAQRRDLARNAGTDFGKEYRKRRLRGCVGKATPCDAVNAAARVHSGNRQVQSAFWFSAVRSAGLIG